MYDSKNRPELKQLDRKASEGRKPIWAFDKAAMAADAIPAKYKDRMVFAIVFTTQWPCCIEIPSGKARQVGASGNESPTRCPSRQLSVR